MTEVELTRAWFEAATAEGDRAIRGKRVATTIRSFGGYRWVGIYDLDVAEIAILGWGGPELPAYPRFARDMGLSGVAVAERRTVVVGDVASDPRYLSTHTTTCSEIVVPVFTEGAVVGVIDVESERTHAFTDSDQRLLERSAAHIRPLWQQTPNAEDCSNHSTPTGSD